MNPTEINLIPDISNPTPDYYCTWQTQLFATCNGGPAEQRKAICEQALFDPQKPWGWAHFYQKARGDLYLVMDDSWDVPPDNDERYYGSLQLDKEKFPTFCNEELPLKALTEKVKALGWKGLGGWVCARESPTLPAQNEQAYWSERLKETQRAGVSYWKVDWGEKCRKPAFRKMLTELGRIHAPDLWIEHAKIRESLPHSDVFRTYDVPALMSIPMTLEKIAALAPFPEAGDNKCLINCEDEAYIAAAGGFAMGIMRHPHVGPFADGRTDLSFPPLHRNLKTKLTEVLRAVRWHRLAPAFGGGKCVFSQEILSDTWRFEKREEEMELWWFDSPLIADFITDHIITKSAPAAFARNTVLPHVVPDEKGFAPYCIATRHPNGCFAVATLGRTAERSYFLPKCDITVSVGDADTIGIFGKYKTLRLETARPFTTVLLQDLAADTAVDITDKVSVSAKGLTLSGALLEQICALPEGDTSEPGAVLKLI
ncbi:MAG: hypothetical protein IJN42_04230 [Clostridia bacterium]|nr:hypothetical protein [Clostridia bacterium]